LITKNDRDDCLMWDCWASMTFMPALTAADELGLFSALDGPPLATAELAAALSLSERAVEGLTGLLSGLGFLARTETGFALTEVARAHLLPNGPLYWGDFFRLIRERPLSHQQLVDALRADRATAHDETLYALSAADEARAAAFTAGMHNVTLAPSRAAATVGDFDGVRRLLDVGGGSGNFCIELARLRPKIHCAVLELPTVCSVADRYIEAAGLSDRVATIPGNFFLDPWPEGYDAFFFSNVFHNWPYEQCLALGTRAFAAAPAGGRIYLQEMLLDEDKCGPPTVAANTLTMIWAAEGKQFARNEIVALLEACGWRDIDVAPTFGYYALISGTKPE